MSVYVCVSVCLSVCLSPEIKASWELKYTKGYFGGSFNSVLGSLSASFNLFSGGNTVADFTLLELAPISLGDRLMLCRSGWPQTHDSVAASLQMLGSQACTNMLSPCNSLDKHTSFLQITLVSAQV